MKRIAFIKSLLACTLALFCCAAQTMQTDWASVVGKTKDAVVVIETDRAVGSGFIVKSNGTLVTNKHVVSGATQISVTLASGEKFSKAFVLAQDEDRDIAILRIEGSDLPYLKIGNSYTIEEGQEVLLIGTPKGLAHTISNGIISAIRMIDGTKVIQTTAPASPGSSGGPLMTREGSVIGILTFGIIEGQNLNFAITSNYIRAMLETLESQTALAPLRTLTKLNASNRVATPDGAEADSPIKTKLDGVLFVAWRTENHQGRSTSEVFQSIVDEILLFLKENRVKLANDILGRSLRSEHSISTYEVTAAAKKAGASHVMVLMVDRPVTRWVKLRLQCLTSDGKLLWEEQSQSGSGSISGSGGVNSAVKNLNSAIAKRLEQTPLPSDNLSRSTN